MWEAEGDRHKQFNLWALSLSQRAELTCLQECRRRGTSRDKNLGVKHTLTPPQVSRNLPAQTCVDAKRVMGAFLLRSTGVTFSERMLHF